MATKLERLQKRASTIAKFELEQLVHPKQSSPDFNFEDQRKFLETILKFYGDVALARFECVPGGFIETMANSAEEMIKTLSRAQSFNVRDGNPSREMQGIIDSINESWRQAYDVTSPHLAFVRTFSGTIDAELNAFQATVSQLKSKCEVDSNGYAYQYTEKTKEAEQQFKASATELEKVMATAREAAKNSAVTEQARAFEQEAKSARTASWIWLGATVVGIAAGIVVVDSLFLKDAQLQGAAKDSCSRYSILN